MLNNVLDLLKKQAAQRPEKTAFFDQQGGLSFGQLEDLAGSIGSFLHSLGLCRRPVAVLMDRSPRVIAAFLGIAAGGCFYAPVDPQQPESRIKDVLDLVAPPLILCDKANEALALSAACGIPAVLYEEICDYPQDRAALAEIRARSIDTDPLYIVFTSGSTGRPKAVAACHRSVLDYTEQLSQVLEIREDTVFGCQCPLYLDACLKEIYTTLKCGASACLLPPELFLDPVGLVEFLNKNAVNTLCWTASALALVSTCGTFRVSKPAFLRTVAFGGEILPSRELTRWREALPGARFFNLYGPTEGTGMCCYYQIDRSFGPDEPIPIGRPFHNTDILLLTGDGRQAADGETGEICIRGSSLALGYYNDPERTGRAFVQNPLNTAYPERIYRTGDLAKKNERGELIFLSRLDRQIKHMGHRIELDEIEAAAQKQPRVELCACVYDRKKGRIVLFYTGQAEERELSEALAKALPRYMLPRRLTRLPHLPLTPGGKLDRAALEQLLS